MNPKAPGDGTLRLLEEAMHLTRSAPLGLFVLHWIGSAPFAIALIWRWNELTEGRTSSGGWAADALPLSLLLVWMNVWRAVFAGKVRQTLGAAEAKRWNGGRVFRLAATQAFLGATKPLALIGSALILFPLAETVSFYRNAAAISGNEDLAPRAVMRKARRLARAYPGQAWVLLPLHLFYYSMVAANLTLLLAMLPQLIRMFTGWETAFSRSGSYFAENELFLWIVLAMAWLVVDPYIQVVHCLRCFRAESLQTGEDVRAGLERIGCGADPLVRAGPPGPASGVALRRRRPARGPAADRGVRPTLGLVALLLFALTTVARAAGVSSGDLQTAVERAVQAPEYSWRLPAADKAAGKTPWILQFCARVLGGIRAALDWVGRMVGEAIRWLLRQLIAGPVSGEGKAPAGALHRSLFVLIALAVAATALLLWRRMRARRAAKPPLPSPVTAARLEDEGLIASELPETRWLELGEECLAREDFRLALRAFFLALLAWLGRSEWLGIQPGKTNREYEMELRRKARALTEARRLFAENVAAYERAWYGMHEVTRETVDDFRARAAGMKEAMAAETGVAA